MSKDRVRHLPHIRDKKNFSIIRRETNHISNINVSSFNNKKEYRKRNRVLGNAIILDTNTLVNSPDCIEVILQGGNTVIIPGQVMVELDRLKNKPDIGHDVRQATRIIEAHRSQGDNSVQLYFPTDFTKLEILDKNAGDTIIMAQIYHFYQKSERDYRKIKVLSYDTIFRTIIREVMPQISVETYQHDSTEEGKIPGKIIKITLPENLVTKIDPNTKDQVIPFNDFNKVVRKKILSIPLNSGVILTTKDEKEICAAIRKKDRLEIIPSDISAAGISPRGLRSKSTPRDQMNWGQIIALAMILDPEIRCVFCEGPPGSGKTLLALACGIEMCRDYLEIIVTRPMIPLQNDDRMGYLPGDIKEKMDPWLQPIWGNLNMLKAANKPGEGLKSNHNRKIRQKGPVDIDEKIRNEKVKIMPLDYVRGLTLHRCFCLVDEAQNLTPHQIKTLITRVGENSKIVFTGDLSQIDLPQLTRSTSGLSYAMARLNDSDLVSSVTLPDGVRSELSNLAEEKL